MTVVSFTLRMRHTVLRSAVAGLTIGTAQAQPFSKIYGVAPIAQSDSERCWAAAAAMLLSWSRGFSVSELDVANQAGGSFLYAYNANNGLPGTEIANLSAAVNLVTEAPQNYTPKGYYDLLAAHGPLWVGTAIFTATAAYGHVRIVTGIDGDGSAAGTTLHIVDPDGGRVYKENVSDFATELEAIAAAQVGPGGNGNLFPQVIRLP